MLCGLWTFLPHVRNFLDPHCDREHVIFLFSLRQEMMDIAFLSDVVVGVLLRYASLILVDGTRLSPKIGILPLDHDWHSCM